MESPDRGKTGRFIRTIEGAERDAQAARLYSRGMTYRQVADELGYETESGAYKAVQRALSAVPASDVPELRRIQRAKLDYLYAKAIEVLESTHYAHTQSGALVVGPDGQPLVDSMPVLHAIDRALRIEDRRAKVDGSDAPTRHEVLTIADIDAELARLLADHPELAGGEAGEA